MKQNKSSINGLTLEMEDFKVSVILRMNKQRASGRYPVQLYIYHRKSNRKKEYNTKLDFDKSEFILLFDKEPSMLRKNQKQTRDHIDKLVKKACDDLYSSSEAFDFKKFRSKLHRKTGDSKNVFWHFNEQIKYLTELGSIGSASWYRCSMNSIKTFHLDAQGSPSALQKSNRPLSFGDVTTNWLIHYERYMIENGKSITTISMFLRALRSIFNKAIKAKDIDSSIYPFGGDYKIKEGLNIKKSLNIEEIQRLYLATPLTSQQQKAKDFWFFSYLSNGMNVKDIIHLRYSQLEEDKFTFNRIKTFSTNRKHKAIEVIVLDFHKNIFNTYGSLQTFPDQFIFNILSNADSPEVIHRKTQAFTRFINQHIKKIAVSVGLSPAISTYYARYCYGTNLIRQGKSIAFVQEAFGHASSRTTENYIAGFQNEVKKDTAIQLFAELTS